MKRIYISPLSEITSVVVCSTLMEVSGNITDGSFTNDDSEPELEYGGEKDGEGDAKYWHFDLWDDNEE